MPTVCYETEDAIFYFDLLDVEQILKHFTSEYQVPDALKILDVISSQHANFIQIRSPYFPFIILDLLKAEKGAVLCRTCQESYSPQYLKSIPIGFGKSPFSVHQATCRQKEGGFLRRLFRRRTRLRMSGFGGEAYLCPEDHELISVRTWIS